MATILPCILAQSAIWTKEFSYLSSSNGQSPVDHAQNKNRAINVSRNDEWRTAGSTCADSTTIIHRRWVASFFFSSTQLKRTSVANRSRHFYVFQFQPWGHRDTSCPCRTLRRQRTTSFTIQFNVFNAYVHRTCEMEERGKSNNNNKSIYWFTITLRCWYVR